MDCDILNNERVLKMYSTDSKNPHIGRSKYDDTSEEDHDDPEYECNHDTVNDSENKSQKDSEYDDKEEENKGHTYLEAHKVFLAI